MAGMQLTVFSCISCFDSIWNSKQSFDEAMKKWESEERVEWNMLVFVASSKKQNKESSRLWVDQHKLMKKRIFFKYKYTRFYRRNVFFLVWLITFQNTKEPLTIGSKEVLASHNKNPVINIKIPAKIHLRRHYYISASKGYRVTTRKCNLFCEKSTLTDTINLATKMLWILPFILKIPNHHFLKNSRLKNSQFAQAESRGATGRNAQYPPREFRRVKTSC